MCGRSVTKNSIWRMRCGCGVTKNRVWQRFWWVIVWDVDINVTKNRIPCVIRYPQLARDRGWMSCTLNYWRNIAKGFDELHSKVACWWRVRCTLDRHGFRRIVVEAYPNIVVETYQNIAHKLGSRGPKYIGGLEAEHWGQCWYFMDGELLRYDF